MMRKRNRELALLLATAMTVAACSTSAVKTEYRTLGATVHAVDLAMTGWGEYVRAGQATADQEAAVRTGYETYQNVARAAKVALAVSSNLETPADLAAAANALITIIESFTKGKVQVSK